MKIVFIINNKNGRNRKIIPDLKKYWDYKDLDRAQFLCTKWKKHAVELASLATEEGCDFLIAVGGDGTLHEVINGVMLSKTTKGASPVIGLLPLGSANDFARTAGISNAVEPLIAAIQLNDFRKIDLGKIDLMETGEIRYFINIAGVGLGAEVVKSLEGSTSVSGSGFNYFSHIIKGFLKYRKKAVVCTGDNWQWRGKLLQLAVANGRFFGNGIGIAPDARVDDGQFQVSIFGDLSVWNYLKNLRNLKKAVNIDHPEVHYYSSTEVRIESDDKCGIEADGEYVGPVPAVLKIIPAAINFLVP